MDIATIIELIAPLVDIALGAVAIFGMVAGGAGAVWLFFRKRISAWWGPYRDGLKGMSELPVLQAKVGEIQTSLAMVAMTIVARGDVNPDHAEYVAGVDGANTQVNLTYARWLGVGKAELLRYDWINYVHPDDREAVRSEWESCRKEHRAYSMRYRMVDTDGQVFGVEAMATPIPTAPPAKQWLGVIRKVIE